MEAHTRARVKRKTRALFNGDRLCCCSCSSPVARRRHRKFPVIAGSLISGGSSVGRFITFVHKTRERKSTSG
uniref:Uncharacterized protein n=1 Tax=Anopheles albimanus TaxID=7167 RepID=A0A182FY20_ANOAL